MAELKIKGFIEFIIALWNFFKWLSGAGYERKRGEKLKYEDLKPRHIIYICIHKTCGKPCCYARPYYESDYISPDKLENKESWGVDPTNRRISLDGYVPYNKSTNCFSCNEYVDYHDFKNVFTIPATKENYEKYIDKLA